MPSCNNASMLRAGAACVFTVEGSFHSCCGQVPARTSFTSHVLRVNFTFDTLAYAFLAGEISHQIEALSPITSPRPPTNGVTKDTLEFSPLASPVADTIEIADLTLWALAASVAHLISRLLP